MNKKKKIKLLASTSLALATTVTLASCGSKTTNYTVEFNVNDPDTSDSIKLDAIEAVKVKKGDKVSSKTLTYEGYTFDGWYLSDGTKYDFSKEVTSNLTLIAKWTKNATPTTPTTPTTEKVTITFNTNGGSSVASQEIDKGTKASEPTAPTKAETDSVTYTFEGWYTDETLTAAFSFDTAVNANITLYAKWSETQNTDSTNNKKVVSGTYNIGDFSSYTGTLSQAVKNGLFTIESGIEMRARAKKWTKSTYSGYSVDTQTTLSGASNIESFTHSIKITNTKGLIFNSVGEGYITVYVQNGSSGATTSSISVVDPDGTKTDYAIPGGDNGSPVVQVYIPITKTGNYQILRTATSGTVDLYYSEYKLEVEESAPKSITIENDGITNYLVGSTFQSSELAVSINYENGTSEGLNVKDLTIDSSKVDFTTAGTYKVKVSYKAFDAEYDVNVYALDSVELGFNAIEKSSNNTLAGNGQYINKTVQQVYKLNDTLDKDALTITAIGKCGDKEWEFSLETNSNLVTISTVDFTTAGEKEVTVTVKSGSGDNEVTKSETFKIYVVDTAVCQATVNSATVCNVYVDKNYTGTIGAKTTLSQYTDDSNDAIEANTFTTIQQALDFLGLQDGISDYRKNVYIAEGTYNEKLEITLPYTSLISTSRNPENTIIEWNSVYGKEDESGFSHVTDSTQTVAVRESAVGCELIGITISNYYNSISAYNGTSYEGSGERALALLVQGDKLLIQNSRLLGWQDTIELFTGRAYIKDSFICGTVDYIFGTNGTAYFDGCTIETRKGKSSGTEDKVNAYITAFKGQNKTATDAPTYGAIFNNCNFTTSSDFVGTYAIARPWASTSNVVYLNSTFDSKLATDENKTIATGLLSDVNIATLNIKFYNNKYADGTVITLTDNLTNVNTTLTAEEAAKYTEFATIFGKSNGGVTYTDVWNPESKSIDVDDKTYYYFNGNSSSTGTSYTYTEKATGKTTTLGGLSIDATSGKLEARVDGDSQWNAGTTISLEVEANTSITVNTHTSSYGYKVEGSVDTTVKYANADTVTYFFADAQTVTFTATSQVYLYSIIVDPNEEAPADATLTDIILDTTNVTKAFEKDATFDSTGLVVKGVYSDNTIVELASTAYTVDSSAVTMTTDGTYDVTVTIGTITKKYSVIVGSVDTTIKSNTFVTYKGGTYSATATTTTALNHNDTSNTIDATSTAVTLNGITYTGAKSNNTNNWLQFNTGATISFKVSGACTVIVYYYQGAASKASVDLDGATITTSTTASTPSDSTAYKYSVTEGGTVTITSTANGYIGAIEIVF